MHRLRVLGGFSLDGPSGAALSLPKRRAEAVLAALAVCGDLGCSRERLLALLWPESDDASARHGLRDALHVIRRSLGSGAVPSGGRLLRLDPAVVVSDTLQFDQAVAEGRHADAVRLYGGPLLDGFHVDDAPEFERWVDGERARLAREYGEALKELAGAAEAAGSGTEAVSWWARAVEHDPLNSHLVLQQVRVLAGIGDRANAIRAAEGHARRLRDEFDLEPDREILATIERIRRGEIPAAAQGGVAASPVMSPAPPTSPDPDVDAVLPAREPLVAEPPRQPEEPWAQIDSAAPPPPRRLPRWLPWAAVMGLVILGLFAAVRFTARSVAAGPRTSIAVLPFRNLSEDSSSAYVVRGLHDELLTQLVKVSSLRVIGRASVLGYEQTSKPLRQIGEELGVGSIVEAGVQIDGNRLRVTVQLLDPVTQAHLWAERYDRTLDDAFAVQSDIAQRVVAALGARLTSAEGGSIAEAPTQVAGAYDFYLQGLAYQRRPGFLRENYLTAQQLYERAVALDSGFALAHAALASVHTTMHKLRYDPSTARLELAGRHAGLALQLDPDLPQAHLATAGVLYHQGGRYRDALDHARRGLRGAPNDPEILAWMGIMQLSVKSWDSAIATLEHARRVDPRDPNLAQMIGDAYHFIRRYPEAIEAYRTASAFAPDLMQPRLSLGWSYFLWRGELDTLRSILRPLPLEIDPGWGGGSIEHQRLNILLWERRPDSVLSLLHTMGSPPAGANPEAEVTRALVAAEAHRLRGDSGAARAGFTAVVTALTAAARAHPDDPVIHIGRGMALAALGRREETLEEVRWIERFENRRQDGHDAGPPYWRARMLALVGETDAALDLIERILGEPSLFSVHELRISPDFDSLRGSPRYLALVEKYAGR